ncbi:MAG: hypothetical protein M1820_004141 [Bogoriella megaspora]|nr:MAG: hypothetical protein M1820_004141 [Bogoriella megaspora]
MNSQLSEPSDGCKEGLNDWESVSPISTPKSEASTSAGDQSVNDVNQFDPMGGIPKSSSCFVSARTSDEGHLKAFPSSVTVRRATRMNSDVPRQDTTSTAIGEAGVLEETPKLRMPLGSMDQAFTDQFSLVGDAKEKLLKAENESQKAMIQELRAKLQQKETNPIRGNNYALEAYQAQLRLLEAQNKERLKDATRNLNTIKNEIPSKEAQGVHDKMEHSELGEQERGAQLSAMETHFQKEHDKCQLKEAKYKELGDRFLTGFTDNKDALTALDSKQEAVVKAESGPKSSKVKKGNRDNHTKPVSTQSEDHSSELERPEVDGHRKTAIRKDPIKKKLTSLGTRLDVMEARLLEPIKENSNLVSELVKAFGEDGKPGDIETRQYELAEAKASIAQQRGQIAHQKGVLLQEKLEKRELENTVAELRAELKQEKALNERLYVGHEQDVSAQNSHTAVENQKSKIEENNDKKFDLPLRPAAKTWEEKQQKAGFGRYEATAHDLRTSLMDQKDSSTDRDATIQDLRAELRAKQELISDLEKQCKLCRIWRNNVQDELDAMNNYLDTKEGEIASRDAVINDLRAEMTGLRKDLEEAQKPQQQNPAQRQRVWLGPDRERVKIGADGSIEVKNGGKVITIGPGGTSVKISRHGGSPGGTTSNNPNSTTSTSCTTLTHDDKPNFTN